MQKNFGDGGITNQQCVTTPISIEQGKRVTDVNKLTECMECLDSIWETQKHTGRILLKHGQKLLGNNSRMVSGFRRVLRGSRKYSKQMKHVVSMKYAERSKGNQ